MPCVHSTDGSDYAALRRALVKAARHFALDSSEAEDLVQSAFLRALEAPSGRVPETRLYAWLARVIRNLAIDRSRARRRWDQALVIDIEHIAAPGTVAVEVDDVPRELDPSQVYELMGTIDPQYKRICEMHYLEGMSYARIAHALDIPVGTVGTRLHRARHLAFVSFAAARPPSQSPLLAGHLHIGPKENPPPTF